MRLTKISIKWWATSIKEISWKYASAKNHLRGRKGDPTILKSEFQLFSFQITFACKITKQNWDCRGLGTNRSSEVVTNRSSEVVANMFTQTVLKHIFSKAWLTFLVVYYGYMKVSGRFFAVQSWMWSPDLHGTIQCVAELRYNMWLASFSPTAGANHITQSVIQRKHPAPPSSPILNHVYASIALCYKSFCD